MNAALSPVQIMPASGFPHDSGLAQLSVMHPLAGHSRSVLQTLCYVSGSWGRLHQPALYVDVGPRLSPNLTFPHHLPPISNPLVNAIRRVQTKKSDKLNHVRW